LLDIGRITQGQIKLDIQPVSVSEVMEQALELSRPIIDQRGHSLSVSLPSRHVKVNADATRLAQVFGNLLHNAAKYTPDGGSVTMSAKVGKESIAVSVRDNGSGIPEAMLSSIFDLFTQLPRSLARSDGGLGIGLTLVKRITEMHHGTVDVSSDGIGQGSEFTIRLPLAATPTVTVADAGISGPATPFGAACRVLIVDDNRDSNTSFGDLLKIVGHEVACAYDGEHGLRLVKSFMPAAILLDIGLPEVDGYEVARRLKADPATRHIYVIALTGYGMPGDIIRAREAGFDAHLLKPARLEEVLKLIELAPKPVRQ
jgi:two-component system CheB/CheR fusion protein